MADEWIRHSLGDIAQLVNGGTPSTKEPNYWGGDVHWVTTSELTRCDGGSISKSERRLSQAGLDNGPVKLVPSGSTLVGTTATVGTIAITTRSLAFNQQITGLIPDATKVLNGFLFLTMQNERETLQGLSAGTSFKRISTQHLRNLEVNVPPLPVQRRIVDLMTHLDNHRVSLVTERVGLITLLETFRRNKWDQMSDLKVPLAKHLVGITAGRSPDTTGERPLADEPGVLKVNSVDPSGEFLAAEAKVLPRKHSMSNDWELHGGEVLITRANTAERVAAVAQVPLGIRPGLFLCDKTLRLDLNRNTSHPTFVAEILLAPQAREQIRAMATGVGSSMVNLSQEKIRSWQLPMPDLETQVSVAQEMQSMRELGRSLSREIESLDVLRARLMVGLLSGALSINKAYNYVLESN